MPSEAVDVDRGQKSRATSERVPGRKWACTSSPQSVGGPELVIRGEHPWLVSNRRAIPVLPLRGHEVSEVATQPLRHGDHPLPHGHRGNDAVHEMRSCLCHPATVAGGTDTPALAASYRQGGPSMAPSCLAADGNAKGSHGCRARLSREATTKPCPRDAQRARPNPKQRMPQVRYDRSSRSMCAETGCSATARFSSQPSRCSATTL